MSSVEYNIISPTERNNSSGGVVMKVLDKKMASKRKGVGEFSDLTRLFSPNYYDKYEHAIKDNKHIFKKFNGIFSQLYDAAHKNGDIIVPFRFDKDRLNIHKEAEKRKIYLAGLKAKYENINKLKSEKEKPKSEHMTTNHSNTNNNNFNINPVVPVVEPIKPVEASKPKPNVSSNNKK